MVERDLAKVDVAGSTPVSRSSGYSLPSFRSVESHASRKKRGEQGAPGFLWISRGAVPKW